MPGQHSNPPDATTRPEGVVDRPWVVGLPKVEMHAHLESIGEELTQRLADRHHVPVPRLTEPRGLRPLLRYLDAVGGLVRSPGDAAEVAYRLATRASESGVVYTETILNPTHWRDHWESDLLGFFDALDHGFEAAERDGLPECKLVVSMMRTWSREEAVTLSRNLVRWAHPRVVALSVDGHEESAGLTGEKFAPAFDLAASSGLRVSVHTGESGGPTHMWDSLTYLHVERIDHGFRCVEDPDLVVHLVERGVTLNLCPSQNLAMGWMDSLADHPMEQLRLAGIPITINTDSPWKFVLADEYKLCSDTFGWKKDVLRQLASNSIDACFAPPDRKDAWHRQIAAYPD